MDDDVEISEELRELVARQAVGRRRRGALLNDTLELAGYLCLVGFWLPVWPPAALAAAGVILVVTSNARAGRARPATAKAPFLERLGAAIGAYQAAAARGRGRP